MATIHELFTQHCVRDLGPLPAPRLAVNTTVHHALQMLVRARRGAVVILDEMTPIGIFTERDVVYRLADGLFAARQNRRHTPIREVMSNPVVTVRRDTPLNEAFDMMARGQFRHLVVVGRSGELRGLLTTADLLQFTTDQFPEQTVHLPPQLRQTYHHPEGA